MTLQHDSQGFLTGTPITDVRRQSKLLAAIRADIATIRQQMSGFNPNVAEPPQVNVEVQQATPVINEPRERRDVFRERDALGRFVGPNRAVNEPVANNSVYNAHSILNSAGSVINTVQNSSQPINIKKFSDFST